MNKYIFLKHKLNINNIKDITKNVSICRPVETHNLRMVKQYVIGKLKNIGLVTYEQHFTQYIRDKEYKFSNIIGHNNINGNKYVLIGAHIDSINNCDGAIDSGTSIGIIIEVVRCLLLNNKDYSLMVIFFDGEEAINGEWSSDNTLIGSKYFVDNYDTSNIKCFYLLDLIGGDLENKIYAYNNNPLSYPIIKKMHDINLKYEHKIFVDPNMDISYKNIADDDIPFRNKGIPYINFIVPTFPKQHHTKDDTYENVNFVYVETFANIFYEYLKKINEYI